MLEYGQSYLEENQRSYDLLTSLLEPEAVTVALTLFSLESEDEAMDVAEAA